MAARFAERNNEMFDSSFKAQFISGIVMPAVFFIGNLSYVLIAVIGFAVFGQKLDLAAVIGLGLIVSGVVVVNLFSDSVSH